MKKIASMACIALAFAGASARLSAHHGAGLFEPEKTVTVSGTVTDFQFVNPHVLVYVSVKGDGGEDVSWGGELTSPNRLARMNGSVKWHKSIIVPGERITMTGHPARNGAPAMNITKLVNADGAVLIE
jgi:hypothetical protein